MRKKTTVVQRFLLLAVLLVCAVASQAQVALSSQTGPNFSLNNTVFPNLNYPLVTVTGTGNASFNTGGVSQATIRITGTYTASNVVIQVSNDNTNFTTVPLQKLDNGNSVTTLTGANTTVNGLYQINLSGVTQVKVLSAATFTGTSMILKFVGSATVGPTVEVAPDPCLTATKTFTAVASGTGTTQFAAPVAGQQVFVCNMFIVGASTMTVQVTQGTGATCGTGTTSVTGVMTPAAGTPVTLTDLGPLAAGNGGCVVIGTAAGAGVVSWVQR